MLKDRFRVTTVDRDGKPRVREFQEYAAAHLAYGRASRGECLFAVFAARWRLRVRWEILAEHSRLSPCPTLTKSPRPVPTARGPIG